MKVRERGGEFVEHVWRRPRGGASTQEASMSGSSVHGFSQARILEWVAMPSSRFNPENGSIFSPKLEQA